MFRPSSAASVPSIVRFPRTLLLVAILAILFLLIPTPGWATAQGCCILRGNVDCDANGDIDIADLTRLIDYMYITNDPLCCDSSANIDADPDGIIDIADLTALIDFMYIRFTPLLPCSNGVFMDPSVRMAAMESVTAKVKTLDWSNLNTANSQLAAYMNTLPEFDTAAVNTEVANVWALFTDGVLFLVGNNRGPSANSGGSVPPLANDVASDQNSPSLGRPSYHPSSVAEPHAAGEELPHSVQARLIETLGSHYTPATSTINSMLSDNGYVTTIVNGSVTALKSVSGDGVLYYDAHGGAGYFNMACTDSVYGLWTTTLITVANLPSYKDDFVARRLCLMAETVGTDNAGQPIQELHYGITPGFVTWYWHDFADNAMVFIDACGGGGAYAAPFRNAILAKGASVYFGWTNSVFSDAAALVAKFIFDRLTGANVAAPLETPPQRPFPYTDVYGDLANRGLTVHPSLDNGTTTFVHFGGSGSFGLLVPSISFMAVEEELERLTINGVFGTDPGSHGRVIVGGTQLNVISWLPTEIQCDLPRDGLGSEGPVTVEVDGLTGPTYSVKRRSNVVNITSWHIPFHYEHHENGAKIVVDLNIHLRDDIHAHREVIHEPPINLVGVPFHHDRDSHGTFTASGSTTSCGEGGCCITSSWSGSGTIPSVEDATTSVALIADGGVDPLHRTFTMALGAGVSEGMPYSDCGSCFPPSDPCLTGDLDWRTDISINEGFNPEPYFTMNLTNTFDVIAGQKVPGGNIPPTTYSGYFSSIPTIKLTWPAVVASFPPDSTAGH